MDKTQQDKFYKALGRALQVARQRRRISITRLEQLSGEQHKTLNSIEAGRPCYFHHAVWMAHNLGLDINQILRDMEGENHGERHTHIRIEDFI